MCVSVAQDVSIRTGSAFPTHKALPAVAKLEKQTSDNKRSLNPKNKVVSGVPNLERFGVDQFQNLHWRLEVVDPCSAGFLFCCDEICRFQSPPSPTQNWLTPRVAHSEILSAQKTTARCASKRGAPLSSGSLKLSYGAGVLHCFPSCLTATPNQKPPAIHVRRRVS